ncbi:MAG: radical SAM protein [Bacillota bacterium]|nr:radical SAM protein [Bacillota bacterium]
MKVNEIFLSIQGESLSAGYPTVFVRFSGCNLRCSFCDTQYAYDEGTVMSPLKIYSEIERFYYKRVCLTGGEPLIQEDLGKLLALLENYTVSIETNGSVDLGKVNLINKHSFVMDMKTPSSGCSDKMNFNNFNLLKSRDEIKFVIGDRNDYEWSKDIIKTYHKKGTITFSPVFGKIEYKDLVSWILRDKLDIRFQLQLHKFIWNPDARGV